MRIADREIGPGTPCYVIAEGGVNHNGSVALAHELVDVAAEAGADAIKFQRRTLSKLLTRAAGERPYGGPHSYGPTYLAHRAALELPDSAWFELARHATGKGIHLLGSAWDEDSVDFLLHQVDVPALKLPSAAMTDIDLVLHAFRSSVVPVILSTGMATAEEIAATWAQITSLPLRADPILLHCVSAYPAEYEDLNLVNGTGGWNLGYSGHERGLATTIAAVALGACVVERHVTIDRSMRGPDHGASLEPKGLSTLIRDIRHVEAAMVRKPKVVLPAEEPARRRLVRYAVAAHPLVAGHALRPEDVMMRETGGGGVTGLEVAEMFGRTLTRSLVTEQPLRAGDA